MKVFAPDTLSEALAIKAVHPDAMPIAGGTDVMVDMNAGRIRPSVLIDLFRVDELKECGSVDDYFLVGAGVTYANIMANLPVTHPLFTASRTIGSPQIRNRGTIGGNLGTASPAGDALPVLAAMDAEVMVAREDGRVSTKPWFTFLLGAKQNSLGDDELIVGVRWRHVRGPGVFSKVGPRNSMVIAIVNLCLVLDEESRGCRLAVGSVAPTVLRLSQAEALLDEVLAASGVWDNPESTVDQGGIEDAVSAVQESIRPITDVRGESWYRRHACGVLTRRALAWALEERGNMQRR